MEDLATPECLYLPFCRVSLSRSVSCVFQVDTRFPQPGSDDPDRVTVTGLPENVDKAVDHLLNLEEEYVSRRY